MCLANLAFFVYTESKFPNQNLNMTIKRLVTIFFSDENWLQGSRMSDCRAVYPSKENTYRFREFLDARFYDRRWWNESSVAININPAMMDGHGAELRLPLP